MNRSLLIIIPGNDNHQIGMNIILSVRLDVGKTIGSWCSLCLDLPAVKEQKKKSVIYCENILSERIGIYHHPLDYHQEMTRISPPKLARIDSSTNVKELIASCWQISNPGPTHRYKTVIDRCLPRAAVRGRISLLCYTRRSPQKSLVMSMQGEEETDHSMEAVTTALSKQEQSNQRKECSQQKEVDRT